MPLLGLGFVALFVGVGAGLARFGVAVPDLAAAAAALHGPLLVGAFFGTVIALERAVAIGRFWAYAAPLATGLGGVAAIAGLGAIAPWLMLAGGVVLLLASVDVLRRQFALFTFTLAAGAACYVVGTLMWGAGVPVPAVVPWWLGFLVLTIAGERLELSRLLPPSVRAVRVFGVILAAAGAGLGGSRLAWGAPLFAAALVALALWLLKQDVARRTVRGSGLTRFIAVCLLSGYVWLAVGGAIMLGTGGLEPGTRSYDAALHALLLGFVFAMVFGHAPIIFPAVLRVRMPYHPTFYIPLLLLHASLVARLAGDAIASFEVIRLGAIGNAVALAAFIASTVSAVVRGRGSRPG